MRSLRKAIRPVPAVLRRLLPSTGRLHAARAAPRRNVGAPGPQPDGRTESRGEISPYLSGDERRIAYKMTDWRFSWQQQ